MIHDNNSDYKVSIQEHFKKTTLVIAGYIEFCDSIHIRKSLERSYSKELIKQFVVEFAHST